MSFFFPLDLHSPFFLHDFHLAMKQKVEPKIPFPIKGTSILVMSDDNDPFFLTCINSHTLCVFV